MHLNQGCFKKKKKEEEKKKKIAFSLRPKKN